MKKFEGTKLTGILLNAIIFGSLILAFTSGWKIAG
ncbi:hypothetical protein SAMN05216565_11715 [Litchfieldia salsa]|uniref:Uncharacterized protein n=1 Tax=Litchfieldia salsa TaxID=930152 RepID=A0A1H0WVN1_9BACI|nr:hypothetical protein SAMN05216565_11715 [Litchfieldia salsa]